MILSKSLAKEKSLPISNKPYPIERILSAATYLTAGGVGFVWFILSLLLKKRVTPFLMYHILQSIFLSIAYFLLVELTKMLLFVLYKLPLINALVGALQYYLNLSINLFFGLSIIQFCTTSIVLYLAITSGMGYYSYLPWFSDVINGNIGRK